MVADDEDLKVRHVLQALDERQLDLVPGGDAQHLMPAETQPQWFSSITQDPESEGKVGTHRVRKPLVLLDDGS